MLHLDRFITLENNKSIQSVEIELAFLDSLWKKIAQERTKTEFVDDAIEKDISNHKIWAFLTILMLLWIFIEAIRGPDRR